MNRRTSWKARTRETSKRAKKEKRREKRRKKIQNEEQTGISQRLADTQIVSSWQEIDLVLFPHKTVCFFIFQSLWCVHFFNDLVVHCSNVKQARFFWIFEKIERILKPTDTKEKQKQIETHPYLVCACVDPWVSVWMCVWDAHQIKSVCYLSIHFIYSIPLLFIIGSVHSSVTNKVVFFRCARSFCFCLDFFLPSFVRTTVYVRTITTTTIQKNISIEQKSESNRLIHRVICIEFNNVWG